jgi:pimeloyl-ACP methyl ester carboxylesterase
MTSVKADAHQEVTYRSGGVDCAADLYLQSNPGRHPSLVIGHGWNQTKQGLRNEGRILRDAGYNVMVVDYRGLGRSGGEVRGQIFPRRQVEDLRNAITYFCRRPEIDADRLGIYGVSFAGGLALQTAAFDTRVRVCVVQSPIVSGRRWMRDLRNVREYHELLVELQGDFEDNYGKSPSEWKKVKCNGSHTVPVPQSVRDAMPPFDPNNPNSCAFPVQTQDSYDPLISFESVLHVLDFNPSDVIDMIAPRPLLIIGNAGGPYDWLHPPEPIQEAYAKAGHPKELIFLPYDAYGLYMEPGRSESMAAVIAFCDRHLKG